MRLNVVQAHDKDRDGLRDLRTKPVDLLRDKPVKSLVEVNQLLRRRRVQQGVRSKLDVIDDKERATFRKRRREREILRLQVEKLGGEEDGRLDLQFDERL
ncbi:MAG: hypothetical protein ACREIF_06815 [Chthoniobacterales bacterium]